MRLTAILWIVLGLVFGLVTLGVMGGGGYYTYDLHTKVTAENKKLEDTRQELERAEKKGLVNNAQITNLKQTIHETEVESANAERARLIGIIVTSTSLIPAVLMLAFLGMGVAAMMKKKKQPADEELEDEETTEPEEADEPPPPKKKPKPKPAPDDEE